MADSIRFERFSLSPDSTPEELTEDEQEFVSLELSARRNDGKVGMIDDDETVRALDSLAALEPWAIYDDDTDDLVGCFTIDPDFSEDTLWVETLAVDPEWRGGGLGKTIMAHLIELARERGFERMMGRSQPNARTIGFYAALGFEITYDTPEYPLVTANIAKS